MVWCVIDIDEETAAKNQPFAAETPWVCLFFVAANVRTQSAYFFSDSVHLENIPEKESETI